MKIPLIQHHIAAILLSFAVGGIPFLWFPTRWESVSKIILWLLAFGLVGLFWMFFEGKTPPQLVSSWFFKLMRGMFIWGPLLGFLIWILPTIFKLDFAESFDYGVILVFFISLIMGFILALVLSIYSYFFIKI